MYADVNIFLTNKKTQIHVNKITSLGSRMSCLLSKNEGRLEWKDRSISYST